MDKPQLETLSLAQLKELAKKEKIPDSILAKHYFPYSGRNKDYWITCITDYYSQVNITNS